MMVSFICIVPDSAWFSQIASNFFTLELSLHPKQIHSTIKELEAAQGI
jgi:hypothetical protein